MSKALKIKNFPEYYVTDDGCVYSIKSGRFKKLKPGNKNGYSHIILRKDGVSYDKDIHRLVGEMFIQNPENKEEINHINGIKNDNRVENLEWVSRSENQKHSHKVLGHKSSTYGKTGKDCCCSKKVLQIKNNVVVNSFFGTNEAERITGIDHRHISDCCLGKRKTTGGYQWQYEI